LRSAAELDQRWVENFNATQRRADLKDRAIAYLGGKCRGCGYDRCPAALDFHHTSPHEKDFSISQQMSWEKLRPELDKCLLLCANCHRETHVGLHPRFLDDGLDAYESLSGSFGGFTDQYSSE
jgi:hypothetical protein